MDQHVTLDPHTVALLRDVPLAPGPLFVCDVDEVVLEFLSGYRAFLAANGMTLGNDAFRLHGNVRDTRGVVIDDDTVTADIDRFFNEQARWQLVVHGATEGLAALARHGNVLLLTAMWHRHIEARRAHLVASGIHYPLVTTEGSKGRAIAHVASERPVVFIDDMPRNHEDVIEHAPHATTIHFMADETLAHHLPPLPQRTARARNWTEVVDIALAAVR